MTQNDSAYKLLQYLTYFLVVIGALFYFVAIVWVGTQNRVPGFDPTTIPPIVTLLITTIGGILATHTGAVFGIAKYLGDGRGLLAMLMAILPGRRKDEFPYTEAQVWAVVLYIVVLILATVFWALDGDGLFHEGAAPVLRNMTHTLVGVVGGVFAVWLNVKPKDG